MDSHGGARKRGILWLSTNLMPFPEMREPDIQKQGSGAFIDWSSVLRATLFIGLALGLALTVWFYQRFWPDPLSLAPPHFGGFPKTEVERGAIVLRVPGSQLIGELAQYDDELFAYMMFDYLRTQSVFADTDVLITYSLRDGIIKYILSVVLPNDFITGLPKLYELAAQFPFLTPEWVVIDDRVLLDQRFKTETLVRAYNLPAYRKLEQLSRKDVVAYARRFIRCNGSRSFPLKFSRCSPPVLSV